MWKMSVMQLGVFVFVFCLTTQVICQNSTDANSTMNANTTTQSPGPFSSSTNMTTPKGAGVGQKAGVGALLTPVLLALHRLC